MMRSQLLAAGTLVTLLITAAPLIVRAQTNPDTTPPPARQAKHHKERHPELMKAMRALERAKGDLVRADRDFGGHRARAAELTEQAIQEIHAAIDYDKN
jgi:Spy/CpxP family protein refolding chaperone